MPKPTKGPRLGAGPAHQRAILRGLGRSLIIHGRVVTTEAKAKRLRPYFEKLVTKARKGGLHNRRQVLSEITDRKVVHRLFDEVAPRSADRPGGYTRIMKLGPRRGDATPMAIIELVDAPTVVAKPQPTDEEPKRGRLRRRRGAPSAKGDEPAGDVAAGEPDVDAEAEVEAQPEPEPEVAVEEPDTEVPVAAPDGASAPPSPDGASAPPSDQEKA